MPPEQRQWRIRTSSWVGVLSWSCSNGPVCGFCFRSESDGIWHPCPFCSFPGASSRRRPS
uniref:Uncharacterized protein n=1 Tax=Anguilla anguilla TaxID=7936 RepID=A0A0E9X871_ANGAN